MTWTVRLLLLLLLPATASALELSSMPPCCTEAKPELNRMGRCAQIAIRGRCDVNLKVDKNRTLRAICPVSSARCSNSPHTKHANRRYCITYTSMADLACVRTTNQRRLRVAHAQSASRIHYAPCIGWSSSRSIVRCRSVESKAKMRTSACLSIDYSVHGVPMRRTPLDRTFALAGREGEVAPRRFAVTLAVGSARWRAAPRPLRESGGTPLPIAARTSRPSKSAALGSVCPTSARMRPTLSASYLRAHQQAPRVA